MRGDMFNSERETPLKSHYKRGARGGCSARLLYDGLLCLRSGRDHIIRQDGESFIFHSLRIAIGPRRIGMRKFIGGHWYLHMCNFFGRFYWLLNQLPLFL